MAEAAEEEEEGIESSSDALDADSELSGSPGSFEERLLSAAEAEEPPPPGVEDLDIAGAARPGRLVHVRGFAVHGTVSCDFAVRLRFFFLFFFRSFEKIYWLRI